MMMTSRTSVTSACPSLAAPASTDPRARRFPACAERDPMTSAGAGQRGPGNHLRVRAGTARPDDPDLLAAATGRGDHNDGRLAAPVTVDVDEPDQAARRDPADASLQRRDRDPAEEP